LSSAYFSETGMPAGFFDFKKTCNFKRKKQKEKPVASSKKDKILLNHSS